MSAEYVDDDLRQSRGDMLWRVRFRTEGTRGEWLYLLVLLEFQSTVDRHMAARVLAYTGQTYLKLIRGGEALAPDGRLPPVLPIVVYNGRPRWSAPEEMGETVAAVGSGLAPFQPRQRYLLIDEHALRAEDLPRGNVVSAQIALEQGSVAALPPVLRELSELLAGPRYASLRQGFAEWTRQVVERSRTASGDPALAGALRALEETGGLREMGSLLAERIDEYVDEQVEKRTQERVEKVFQEIAEKGVREGVGQRFREHLEKLGERRVKELAEQHLEALAERRAEEIVRQRRARSSSEGLERGLEQERALLSRQTARKFDAETAAALAALLGRVDDPERLAEIGEQVIDCATGEELLARAEHAVEGDRPPENRSGLQSANGEAP